MKKAKTADDGEDIEEEEDDEDFDGEEGEEDEEDLDGVSCCIWIWVPFHAHTILVSSLKANMALWIWMKTEQPK